MTSILTSSVRAGALLGLLVPALTAGCSASGTLFPPRDLVCPSGETPPCETTEPALPDSERRAEVAEGEMDGAFLIRGFRFAEVTGDEAPGFNLDGIDSGFGTLSENCEEEKVDYLGLRDPEQVGVDNAFAGLVPMIDASVAGIVAGDEDEDNDCVDAGGNPTTEGCLSQVVNAQVANGEVLLVLQVSGWNGTGDDDAIDVALVLAETPDGGAPALDGSGLPAAGQRLRVSEPVGSPGQADVFGGRLRFLPDFLPLELVFGGQPVPFTVLDPELRFDVESTATENGVIGGALASENIIQIAEELFDNNPTIPPAIDALSDLIPDAEDPQVCTRLSVGADISVVPVSLEGS
ncbi:MAG: hypothetical protein ACFCGT_19475 [Sandaracinaceae bacterium]